jgi:putative spermidine/putrescine transport system permease protein
MGYANSPASIVPLSSPAGRRRIAASAREQFVAVALLAPLLIFVIGCFFVPLGALLRMSFTGTADPFSAYREIAESEVYRRVFVNTLILALNVALITVVLSYPTAWMLSRLRGFRLSVAVGCLLFPLWISVLVRTFAWILLLEQNGPVNRTLMALGLVAKPIPMLFSSPAVYIGMVHVLLPYALLPIYSAMRAVDQRLLMASDGLGASPFQTFFKIYAPLTFPGAASGFLLVFLLALGFYITPAMLGGIDNLTIAMLIDVFVTERLVWPLAAAASFWLLLLVLVLVLISSRFLNFAATVTAR